MTFARPMKVAVGSALRPVWLLGLLVVLSDVMLWQVSPGVGFVLLVVGVAAAAHVSCLASVSRQKAALAWSVLLIALIPAFDLVQFLSVIFAIVGLAGFAALMVLDDTARLGRIIARLPWQGAQQEARDLREVARTGTARRDVSVARFLRDWGVPLVLGLVFATLFVVANPVLDEWSAALLQGRFDVLPGPGRVVFWLCMAALCWPLLRLQAMRAGLIAPVTTGHRAPRGWLINARSVARSLVLFNALFAVQSLTDVAIFSGGLALPDGISYAQYAHRGAYPLLVTALLAGGFAIAAQSWLTGQPWLRTLLMIWVAQNVLLVATSILRLDLYIDAYGLTRMRVAAYVWMLVVAAGLVLMIWQLLRTLPVRWMLARSAILGIAVLYFYSLTNIAGFVARHNLARYDSALDGFYLCNIGEGAKPAIMAYELAHGVGYCYSTQVVLSVPRDIREWGYRNFRLRRNVAALIEGAE